MLSKVPCNDVGGGRSAVETIQRLQTDPPSHAGCGQGSSEFDVQIKSRSSIGSEVKWRRMASVSAGHYRSLLPAGESRSRGKSSPSDRLSSGSLTDLQALL